MTRLDDLRAALAGRTPGEWRADVRVGTVQVYAGPQRECLDTGERVIVSKSGTRVDGRWELDPQDIADARLIASWINAADDLLAVADLAQGVVDAHFFPGHTVEECGFPLILRLDAALRRLEGEPE